MRYTTIVAGLALLLGAGPALAQGQAASETGAALVYKTYCIGCHTTEVHWREKRLATDWKSLRFQVRRWLDNNGIALSEDEATELARYLNRRYYRFKEAGRVVGIAPATRGAGTQGRALPLPAPHAARIDVHEVRVSVVADAARLQ